MQVIEKAMAAIIWEATQRLPFPVKVSATCPSGYVASGSLAYAGAPLALAVMKEEVSRVTFPVTLTCIGINGAKIVGTIQQPERRSEGRA
jgi:hypothetical protein